MENNDDLGLSGLNWYQAFYFRKLTNILVNKDREKDEKLLDKITKLSSICLNLTKLAEVYKKDKKFSSIADDAFLEARNSIREEAK